MEWVDRLLEVTGWREPPQKRNWEAVESALGTVLPSDYKELHERFGPGLFSQYIRVEPIEGQNSMIDSYENFKDKARTRRYGSHSPYGVNGPHGFLLWGATEFRESFFWLADAAIDPNFWPVLGKDDVGDSYRYDMGMSEFIYRVITEPSFEPFAVADPDWPRTFDPLEG